MIKRKSNDTLLRLARGFPIVAITGPRQSGKTTLARQAFPDKPYLSMEDPDVLALAESDPRGLLAAYPHGAVLDEAQRGALFETLVVNEVLKQRMNDGQPSNLFFWRDSKGLEIDLLLERGDDLTPVEIKSGQTIVPDFFVGLRQWLALSGNPDHAAWLVYGGEGQHQKDSVGIIPWNQIPAQLPRIAGLTP